MTGRVQLDLNVIGWNWKKLDRQLSELYSGLEIFL